MSKSTPVKTPVNAPYAPYAPYALSRLCLWPLSILCITTLFSAPVNADALDDAAKQMLSDLQTNYTAPQAFKGQTHNTYTPGTAFIRAPQKTYQLLNFDRPTMSAGCGGINLHGGSFSHINAAAMKDSLKSITSAVPGLIFQMAIESVEPLLGANIKSFYSWAEQMNRFNINSCESAKMLVGTAGDALGMTTQSSCNSIGLKLGMDAAEVRQKCNKGTGTADVLANPAANKDIPPFTGNLMWESLKRYSQLDNGDRELIMSITGTTIFYEQSSDASPAPKTVPPTITAAKDLLNGNATVTSGTVGNIIVAQLTCGHAGRRV
jgi:conjugative transfer pilus assembly protein TraH